MRQARCLVHSDCINITTAIEAFGPMAVEGSAAAVLDSAALGPEAILAAGAVLWGDVPAQAKVLPPFLQNVELPGE